MSPVDGRTTQVGRTDLVTASVTATAQKSERDFFISLSLCPSLSPLSRFLIVKRFAPRHRRRRPTTHVRSQLFWLLPALPSLFPLSLLFDFSATQPPFLRHAASAIRLSNRSRDETGRARAHPSKRFRFRASDIMMEYYADRRDLSERAQQEGYTYQVAAARGCLFVIRNIY